MQLQFNFKAFLLFLLFLVIEIFIAVYVTDSFIRPFGGDFLVIFLVYYFVKSFVKIKTLYLVISVFLFACVVETGQYFHMADVLQVKNKILRIMIGTSFSWEDILAYALGAVSCYLLDTKIG